MSGLQLLPEAVVPLVAACLQARMDALSHIYARIRVYRCAPSSDQALGPLTSTSSRAKRTQCGKRVSRAFRSAELPCAGLSDPHHGRLVIVFRAGGAPQDDAPERELLHADNDGFRRHYTNA